MTLLANSEENWVGREIILVAGLPDQSKAEAHWRNNGPCGFGADSLQGHFGTLGHLALNKKTPQTQTRLCSLVLSSPTMLNYFTTWIQNYFQ